MQDMKKIREQAVIYQRVADAKGIDVSIQALLDLDVQHRELRYKTEQMRHFRRSFSEQMVALRNAGQTEQAQVIREQAANNKKQLEEATAHLRMIEDQLERLMLLVPNLVSDDTPQGSSDVDNVERYRVGTPPDEADRPWQYDHMELGIAHGMIELDAATKIAGSRNYLLQGMGAQLAAAIRRLAMDTLLAAGYRWTDVPLLVREQAMMQSGFFPLGAEQSYHVPEQDKWLVGTSEVSLIASQAGRTLDLTQPLRLAADTVCFRSEVGSAGRDVHGLYRVHQFQKVEQVIFCTPQQAAGCMDELLQISESIMCKLELPYRVVAVCTGDMSQKNWKQWDIEAWMPSRRAYKETHSISQVGDFQARRAKIRYRHSDGSLHDAYTLNGTAAATPRLLIPFLEIHQQADHSIAIPVALQPYLGGITQLEIEAPS